MKHLPTRVCKVCQEEKLLTEFKVNKSAKLGYENICKKCANKKDNERHKKIKEDPDSYKKYLRSAFARKIKSCYGLTVDQYTKLTDKYKVCQICGEEFSDKVTPHIDHNHATGKVRSLLCRKCNLLLGYAKDSTQILKSAIKYLKKFDK